MLNPGHTTVNFLGDKEFFSKIRSNSNAIQQDRQNNAVEAPFTSEQTIIKTGTNGSDFEHSYTEGAYVCSAGALMLNGAELHSHMTFHMVPYIPEEPESFEEPGKSDLGKSKLNRVASSVKKSVAKFLAKPVPPTKIMQDSSYNFVDPVSFIKGFTGKLESFFGHLDELLKLDKFEKGENLYLDFVLTGGNFNNVCSVESKNTIEKLVEARMQQTLELADKKDVTIHFAKSKAWGQEHLSNEDKKSGSSCSHLHYDPKENMTSIGHSIFTHPGINDEDIVYEECFREFSIAPEHLPSDPPETIIEVV